MSMARKSSNSKTIKTKSGSTRTYTRSGLKGSKWSLTGYSGKAPKRKKS
jgi:hypothetical protein